MTKLIYPLLCILIFSILIVSAPACKSNSSSSLDESIVRAYADPATDTTLQGLSENILTKYTQYGNSQFKTAVTQEMLDQASNQITNQLGIYVSKEFLRVEELQGYIVVHYKAKYTKGNIGVRMAFDKDHLVAGQYFE